MDEGHGGHGGGDAVMVDDIFAPPQLDRLKRSADYVQGAYSILTGIAANKSIENKKIIYISDLVQGLPHPCNPEMINEDENISYVSDTKHNWEAEIDYRIYLAAEVLANSGHPSNFPCIILSEQA